MKTAEEVAEEHLDELFLEAFDTGHPAMLDWARIKMELKNLRARDKESEERVKELEAFKETVDRVQCVDMGHDKLEARIKELEAALAPVAQEIRDTGNEYKESDWNPGAHIQKPLTLTIKEARLILALSPAARGAQE